MTHSNRAQSPSSLARRVATSAVSALLLATSLASPTVAIHPNHPIGHDPDRAVETGAEGIDQIDLFSGSLSVGLPIGPFTVLYNSNVWRYQVIDEDGDDRIQADVDAMSTVGLGWHLGLGEIYRPDHWYNPTGQWLYVSPDGGRHLFYDTLHEGEDDGATNVRYTRDGTYLRFHKLNSSVVDLEFPDGTTRRFLTGSASAPEVFRLHKVWSPFGSAQDPDLTVTYNGDDSLRTLTDRYGRTHYLHLTDQYPRFERTITQVDLEGFGGQRAVFDFIYAQRSVQVSCKDTASGPSTIQVPLLVRIDDQVRGTSTSMGSVGAPAYHTQCANGIEDLPGVLTGIDLPTGGKIRWEYQEYEFPPSENASPFNATAGVKTRTLRAADDSQLGVWRYRSTKVSAASTGGDPEMHTEVTYPTGHCTKHYFDARYTVDPGAGLGWEYGLPFVYSASEAGRYLSTQVFSDNAGGTLPTCDANTLLRSTYVRFRHDQTPGCAPSSGPHCPQSRWYDLNRQLSAMRTVFHDDNDRYTDTELSDFDGLGNFRRQVDTGSFWDGSSHSERREQVTQFNRVAGTYGTAGYTPPATNEPWVLRIYDSVVTHELDAVGESSSKTEFGFENATGFLFCTRMLASGTTRGAHDVLQTFDHDALGQVTQTKTFGGDLQALPLTGGACGNVPSSPVSWTQQTYAYGALTSTRQRTPTGNLAPFYVYDTDVDPSTGQVIRQRDLAGFEVTRTYDAAGRPTGSIPQEGASLAIAYTNAGSGQPAKITETRVGSGGVLASREVILDDFGRPTENRRLLPGGVWTSQRTERNARGWVTSISEWGLPSRQTQFLGHDAFGRPSTLRPPDGASHDVRLSRLGNRQSTVEVRRSLVSGEQYVATTSTFDRYGRLRRTEEPSGTGGTLVPTVYSYDVGGRLTALTTGAGPTQSRSYTYDNRGFLLQETHPEKGAQGNGSVTYGDYDALGNAGRLTDGPNDLRFTFDPFGRPLEIRDAAQGNRLVVERTYDGASGLGNGRLWTSERTNYVDLPWNPAGEEAVKVRQTYAYQGLRGQVSQQWTDVQWSLDNAQFVQAFSYDELGALETTSYPRCTLSTTACVGSTAASSRQVTRTYDQGMLTGIPGWLTSVTYHGSGLRDTLQHANGVTDHQDRDPDFGLRPRRLWTSGATPVGDNFDTGSMLYDGAGSLDTQGLDAYRYDRVGRLVSASLDAGQTQQQYTYDPFGNLTSIGGDTTSPGFTIDPATNRVTGSGATYDAAGNLLSWDHGFNTLQFRYDTHNRMVRQAHMFYLYDAEGERVASFANFELPQATFHLRDLDNRVLSALRLATDGSWSRDRDYVYAHGRLVGFEKETAASRRHFHLDHLGSPRLLTRPDASVDTPYELLPYGEELFAPPSDDPMRFTGHERDFSTGSDHMHARHYHAHLGRFLSVDPERGNPAVPQSLNRYAYVLGDPMNRIDPDGREEENQQAPPPWDVPGGDLSYVMQNINDIVEVIGTFLGIDPQPEEPDTTHFTWPDPPTTINVNPFSGQDHDPGNDDPAVFGIDQDDALDVVDDAQGDLVGTDCNDTYNPAAMVTVPAWGIGTLGVSAKITHEFGTGSGHGTSVDLVGPLIFSELSVAFGVTTTRGNPYADPNGFGWGGSFSMTPGPIGLGRKISAVQTRTGSKAFLGVGPTVGTAVHAAGPFSFNLFKGGKCK